EESWLNDAGLLPMQHLSAMRDLADVDDVGEELPQRRFFPERARAALPILRRPALRAPSASVEELDDLEQRLLLGVEREDRPHLLGLRVIDSELSAAPKSSGPGTSTSATPRRRSGRAGTRPSSS